MATNLPANRTPPGFPDPGPPGGPSPIDPFAFTPSPSMLQQPGFSAPAVNAAPAPAGPVRIQPTANGQDYGSRPFQGDSDPGGTPT